MLSVANKAIMLNVVLHHFIVKLRVIMVNALPPLSQQYLMQKTHFRVERRNFLALLSKVSKVAVTFLPWVASPVVLNALT